MTEVGNLFAGRYRIESQLGQGGMGSVYPALDESFPGRGRRVVVKVPHASLLNEEFRRRFEREIDDLAALEHPRVIPN